MRNVAVVLLWLAPALAAAEPDPQQHRARVLHTLELVERLQIDDATANKLLPVVSTYTRERERLLAEYRDAEQRLGLLSDAKGADQVLDDMLATEGSLVALEAKLVVRLRHMLPAEQAAKARVMLSDSQQPRRRASPAPVPASTTASAGYDPDALFPPGSALRAPCDPFASMHGCRY